MLEQAYYIIKMGIEFFLTLLLLLFILFLKTYSYLKLKKQDKKCLKRLYNTICSKNINTSIIYFKVYFCQ